MKKYTRTKNGEIYNLESKEVSSWEYIDNDTAINGYGVEGAFYSIYYFDENKGRYSEYDGKGGHSCIFIDEKDILRQADTIKELCDYVIWVDKETSDIILITDIHNTNNNEYSKEELNDVDVYYAIKLFNNNKVDIVSVAKMDDKGDLELI